MIKVEVVYARPDRQWSIDLALADGTTAKQAAAAATNAEPLRWVKDLNIVAFAVWGREVAPEHQLRDGDRLELLRPLPVEPMETRRRRAASQKS